MGDHSHNCSDDNRRQVQSSDVPSVISIQWVSEDGGRLRSDLVPAAEEA